MSLNEEYLDELLKAVTTEKNVPQKPPVLNKNPGEEEIAKSTKDSEAGNEKEQEKRHAFSEDDLTEMLEHLDEIDASSISDNNISTEASISESMEKEPAMKESNYEKTEKEDLLQGIEEDNLLKIQDDKTEIDEGASMAESAEYMSDIEKLLKNIEESEEDIPEDMIQEPQTDNFNEIITEISDDEVLSNDLNGNNVGETGGTVNEQKESEEESAGEEKQDSVGKEETIISDIFDDGLASDNEDIMSLLGAMDDNGELEEIGDLLQKDENHEAISNDEAFANDDMMAILEQAAELEKQDSQKLEDNFIDATEDSLEEKKKGKFFGRKKEKKSKKVKEEGEDSSEENVLEEGEPKEKKKGFFTMLLELLFEEEEEEKENKVSDVGEEGATDENLAILEQLDNENLAQKKKEKKKKKKKPKEPKKEKTKKPKKEKQPKVPKEPQPDEKPDKKIPKKKIIIVGIFAISILTILLIVTIVIPNKMACQNATIAYEEQDYKTVYATLAGIKLSGEEKEVFKKTTAILELQEKYDAYVNYDKMSMKIEALNSLFQGIIKYDKISAYAEKMKVSSEVDVIYQQILSSLSQNYGISEEEAREIIAYDKVTYTKKLDSLINGTEFIDPNAPVDEPESLQDMLPEEELMMQEMNRSERETEEALQENSSLGEENSNSDEKSMADKEAENKELYSGSVNESDASVDFSKSGTEEQ